MTDEQLPVPHQEHHELQELKELINKHGQPVIVAICVVLALAIGVNFYKSKKAKNEAEATLELFKAKTPVELQSWIDRFDGNKSVPVATIRMANANFTDGNYQAALDIYEAFAKKHLKHDMLPAAEMGQAQCREGLGQLAEALAGFERFVEKRPGHFLHADAVMGKARCLEQLGRFDEARIVYEDFIASAPEGDWLPRAEDFLKRLDRRQAMSAAGPSVTSIPGPVETVTAAPVVVPVPPEAPDAPVATGDAPEQAD